MSSTSSEDRTLLVKWMFSSAALNPSVDEISSVTEKQRDSINKDTANLFTRLLAENCKEQTKKAFIYEGDSAIQNGFKVLGEVASRELFLSPEVSAGMSGLLKHMNMSKLESILK